jgi:hypothetical protein
MFLRNVVDKIEIPHFTFRKVFSESPAEICGRAGQAIDVNVIGHMRFACWISKAANTHTHTTTHTHTENNTVFPRQQFLDERASLVRLSGYLLYATKYSISA